MILSASERVSCLDAMAMLSASIVVHSSVSPSEEEDFSQFKNKPVTASI
jgi:hypothetical protein